MFGYVKAILKRMLNLNNILTRLMIVNDQNIDLGVSGVFNQRARFWCLGSIEIGRNFSIGYKYGGGFEGRICEFQTRDKNAIIKIGENLACNNGLYVCARKSITIGNDCLIGSNVTIMDHNAHGVHPNRRRNNPGTAREIVIEDNVWLGNNVTILKGSRIGKNSIVSVSSVVDGVFPENSIIKGNPAKIYKIIE